MIIKMCKIKKQCFLRERESFMEYFIVFDAGAVGIFLLILLLGGTAAVGAGWGMAFMSISGYWH